MLSGVRPRSDATWGMIAPVPSATSAAPADRTRRRLAVLDALPAGSAPVAAGLVVSGLTAYGFLAITARVLGADAYAPVSVLWTLVFIAAPGLFLPVEQEVGRAIAGRRALGVGARSVVIRAAAAGGVVALVVGVAAMVGGGALTTRLFDGDASLLGGFVVAIIVYLGYFLVRGVLAGIGSFGAYGALLTAEGLTRVAAVVALAAGGVHAVGLYGLAVGLPVLAGVAAGLMLRRGQVGQGPPARWSEISHAVGFLVAGSLLGQILVNAGPVAVKLLAGPGDLAMAGTFLNGVVIARIPLFFFQAIQASLLPALAAEAAAGQIDRFRRGLLRLMAAVAGVAILSLAGSALLGPFVVSHFFGAAFRLSHLDMALLALASGVYMVALGLVQGIIALGGHRLVPLGWLVGVVGFVVALPALGATARLGLALRVEIALVAGSLLSLAMVAAMLEWRLRGAAAVG